MAKYLKIIGASVAVLSAVACGVTFLSRGGVYYELALLIPVGLLVFAAGRFSHSVKG